MGALERSMEAAGLPAAESLLDAFKTISAAERRRHASVLNYWLSIRGDKEFPPLHDLDPLELSDAGPNSILLELISGGHDAEIRHIGEALRFEGKIERIIDAPNPTMLAIIAKKQPIVAISRDFLAFEDEYEGPDGPVRCSATLLPLSAGGAWVDYVYAMVTVDGELPAAAAAEEPAEAGAQEPATDELRGPEAEVAEEPAPDTPATVEGSAEADEPVDSADSLEDPESGGKAKPGFSKLFDNLVGLTGFYGHGYKVEDGENETPSGSDHEPAAEQSPDEPATIEPPLVEQEQIAEDVPDAAAEPVDGVAGQPAQETVEAADDAVEHESIAAEASAEAPAPVEAEAPPVIIDPVENPAPVASEGPLHSKLADVRAKADEARQAKLRANAALYEGLSAAYDFALDAEDAPEEYLRMVEAEGLKIQLRSPMRPVVKLAFDGMCDDATIRQLEAVLAWALDNELPRGTLGSEIEAAGGIGPILSGETKAAA
jgi:hypothetical protein